ncbi:acyl-CoA dehydrogenase family protein [Acinetobacter johnsonii]|uniref:Acyl-CoA dehydrogenase n=1 Tax=Acinetobacter johnsonii TaxID=40214 RepID=A0A427US25_ACIJO|nr:acyl-CoA dehydrogenase family protein [Acinetobacter johnsonii]MDH0835281.1 acyl-CoA dehydrogenase family protein [Acinetobacter johnsonii]MDH0838499.1 acyl-CoA dehydrogenase family protein [Acinetobacter johnsonii]MDH1070451.1 acyl-CoA dehydrogenase family protein [Acinetobacter johnsonii]MDH1278559.1 acyl-CoA dehydrogenase family protein [Acinetobacter johnsonii]MDQ8972948.1 acyl-CoA dehydrogenase family protein [Acinetobacter johnsonii]
MQSGAIRPLHNMLPRNLFNAEHEAFRETVRKFYAKEVVPNIEKYEQQQHVDRELWNKAGAMGLLCATMPEAYGGSGVDRLYSMILIEEQAYAMDSSTGFSLHSDIVANYINNFGSEAQKHYWLTRMASGETVTAIAMTEPGTGSDLQAVRTTAVLDGDDYIINGSKIFITNGYLCDMAIVVCKTGDSEKGSANLSLIIVEADRAGFSKGKPLNKIGMKGQDTCELFFDHVRVPKENLLGMEGMGFMMLMKELAWERMLVAIICQAGAEAALAHTVQYTKERKAFGKTISSFQNTRFKLAELRTEIDFCRAYLDRCMQLQLEESLGIDAAAAAKYKISEMFSKVVDECLQLHGGYGYMLEYPIARAYLDNRANRIYAGTNEIMKELISRSL